MRDIHPPSSDGSHDATVAAADKPHESHRLEAFRFVGEYGLLVCLGEGGMGEVWAARDARSPKNRVVAVKTTKQTGAEAARVLHDEARIASLIDHPNVCSVHNFSQAEGIQFLVMDYCDGASLHDLVQVLPDKKLPIPLACHIISEVAAGLQAAHEVVGEEGQILGVVHRDVSPQNVLISTRGIVTVTDFGVAKARGQAHKATETGEMKGKLSYMAPEQVTSKDVDARADVFALGCVLYQITLGRRPFHGDDALATLYQLLEQELVAPTSVDADYPSELEAIVKRSLAKNRDDRFSSAAEMQRALQSYLVHSGESVSSNDVVGLLMGHLGGVVVARKEELKRRNGLLSETTRENQKKPQLESAARGSNTAEGETLHSTSLSSTRAQPRPVSKRSRVAALAIFASTAVLGILALKSFGSKEESTSLATAPLQPELQKIPATQEEPITLEIKAVPESARIILDEQFVGSGTFTQQYVRSEEGHLLKVEAPGYLSTGKSVVFDRSRSITIALSKAPEVVPIDPGPRPGAGKVKVKVKPKTPTMPTALTGPGKTPKKPPRTLDSDNPFANP